jgi:hypothetical protein
MPRGRFGKSLESQPLSGLVLPFHRTVTRILKARRDHIPSSDNLMARILTSKNFLDAAFVE